MVGGTRGRELTGKVLDGGTDLESGTEQAFVIPTVGNHV